jgi:TetR/AcrR family transcriptional regulator, transcriptional repressor for nem operon
MARPKEFDEDTALMRAMELFWEQGYAASSLAQLTACMGINRQSLYDTYGDKRGLFLKALDRYCGLIGGRLLASLATEAPGLDEIKATIAALIGFLVEFPKPRACLMANTAMEIAPHDRTVADKVQTFHRSVESAFAAALRNARRRGEIASTADPAALAKYLVSVANGMAVAAKAGATRQNLRDIAGVALTALQPAPIHPRARK